MPGAGQVGRKSRLGSREKILAIAAGQVRRLLDADVVCKRRISHPIFISCLPLIQLNRLIEVIRDIELAAIVHLAVLNAPWRQAIRSIEDHARRGIGISC